jgi:hypothetical protein
MRLRLFLIWALMCGCAPARPWYPPPLAARAQALALFAEVERLAAQPAGTCGEMCRAGDRICEAAAKICEIAGADPGDADLAERCARARRHCDEARDRCRACGG